MVDTILGIASLAIAVAGLVPVWRRRDVIVSLLLSFLLLTTGTITFRRIGYERQIRNVQAEIVKLVTSRVRSVDDIYEELRYVEFPVVNEALSRSVDEGAVGHRVLEFQMTDGSFTRVRGYYRP